MILFAKHLQIVSFVSLPRHKCLQTSVAKTHKMKPDVQIFIIFQRFSILFFRSHQHVARRDVLTAPPQMESVPLEMRVRCHGRNVTQACDLV